MNVILLTVDCLRYDRCGFNGHHRPTTPTLDKLAKESVVFDYAYSTGPYTTESFPGILAGQHSHNGCYYQSPVWKALSADSETIATHLRSNGFDTVATLTNPHLTRDRNFNRGFDSFRNLRTQGIDSADDDSGGGRNWAFQIRERMRTRKSTLNRYTLPYIAFRAYQAGTDWPTISAEEVLTEFANDLEAASEPFFGWTHLMDLHAPIHPGRANKGGLVPKTSNIKHFIWDGARAANIHEPRYNALYDSALRYIDEQIARLIQQLKTRGKWDDTILLITGDHGEALFDRGFYSHPRHNLHREAVHVPLLIRCPGLDPSRISTQFSLAWIHDLVSELLEIPDGDFTSTSNVEWFSETRPEPPLVVSDSLDGSGHSVAVRDDERTVINYEGDPDTEGDFQYLYEPIQIEYRSDRGERIETIVSCGDLLNRTEELLTDGSALRRIDGEFSREMEQRLQDLGYKM